MSRVGPVVVLVRPHDEVIWSSSSTQGLTTRTEFSFALFLSSSSKVKRGRPSLLAVDRAIRSLYCEYSFIRVMANRMSSGVHGENDVFSLAMYSSTFVLPRESSIFLTLKNQMSSWKT